MKLAWNRYGKARVRLVKVRSGPESDTLCDLTVDVQLEGAFDPVYVDGDNATCLATDTMKNTVYAFARQYDIASAEEFADRLAAHFVAQAHVTSARLSIEEHRWEPLSNGKLPHPHAFMQPGGEQWTTVVTHDAAGRSIRSGLRHLVLLKTRDSAFSGFPRDRYTTLPETHDRIMATSVTAVWRYRGGISNFGLRDIARAALIETFAAHQSQSVQHTLYAMAEAALERCAEIEEITLSLPNRHHLLVDLRPFGLDNPNEVFVATDQPYGLIEATVRRDA